MLRSLDNSNGIQYYGGNDPAKMSGRFKKGGSTGGGSNSVGKSKTSNFVLGLKKQVSDTAKYIGSRTNKPELIRMAVQNTKNNLIDKATTDIKRGNQRLTTKTKIDSNIRRQKRAMTSGDISRNASIQSARLETQGQLNLLR
jgi:hypothetical protein